MSAFTSKSTRRSFLASTGLGALSLGALAACGGTAAPSGSASSSTSAAAAGPSSVAPGAYGDATIQLSWIKNIEFAGEYLADSKGHYKDAGFGTVTLKTGPVDSADALVASGAVQFGLSSPDATARYISDQGAPLKVIASTYQKNPFCLLSLKEGKPISTVADLAGKIIGIQPGANQVIFNGFVKANNIDTSTFKTQTVGYDPKILTENKVDAIIAYVTNEPFLVAGEGFTPVVLAFADNGLPLTAETIAVTQDTLEGKRDMVKAFLTAEIKGWNAVHADLNAAAQLTVDTYGKGLGLKLPEQLKEITAQDLLIFTDDTKKNGVFTLTDDLQTQIIGAIKNVGVDIAVADLFDLSIIKEIYAGDPSLIVGS
ncbi:MAG: ABC transporter substrate-binding protein [Janthinobacterium lividum]